jgi:hypothetical protein
MAARRRELERALDELEAGAVLVVTKLDRLVQSKLDLLRIIDGKEGAGVQEPWRALGRHHDFGGPSDAHCIVRDLPSSRGI